MSCRLFALLRSARLRGQVAFPKVLQEAAPSLVRFKINEFVAFDELGTTAWLIAGRSLDRPTWSGGASVRLWNGADGLLPIPQFTRKLMGEEHLALHLALLSRMNPTCFVVPGHRQDADLGVARQA
jgi:hypothetical protein